MVREAIRADRGYGSLQPAFVHVLEERRDRAVPAIVGRAALRIAGQGRSAAPATCTTRPQNSSRVIDSSSARSSVRTTVRRPPGVSQIAMACEGIPPTNTTVHPTITAGPT